VIVVDASPAIKLLVDEEDSIRVRALWTSWVEGGETICSPPLFQAESLSVLRRKVHQQRITREVGRQAFETFFDLGVEVREPGGLYRLALGYAERLGLPTIWLWQILSAASSGPRTEGSRTRRSLSPGYVSPRLELP